MVAASILASLSGRSLWHLLTVALSLAQLGLGLLIAGIAFRGYLRNRSPPMLYLAVGIALLAVVAPFAAGIALDLGAGLTQAPVVREAIVTAGLLSILYSLYRGKRARTIGGGD